MSLTPSNMMPLGTMAPDFNLYDTSSGRHMSLNDISGEHGTLVIFMCNHCPFVVHVIDGILSVANDYIEKGFGVVAISANDIENYPQDGPEQMRLLSAQKEFSFPYLYDETQEVSKSYQAACTPDFYIFDAIHQCVYRGQMDASRPGNSVPVTGQDLRKAMDAMLLGETVSRDQTPSIGCNIKWKS